MSKKCDVCNKKIGILTGSMAFKDGRICEKCYKKVGVKGKLYEIDWAKHTPISVISEAIKNNQLIDVKSIVRNDNSYAQGIVDLIKKETVEKQIGNDKQHLTNYAKDTSDLVTTLATSHPTKIAHNKLMFNDDLKLVGFNMGMLLPKTVLTYSEITDYEIHQNGSSISRGSINLVRGAGMGLATGGLGLIVGLATGGKKKTKEVSEKIEIFIKTNDPNNPTYTLVTSSKRLKTDSKQYAQDFKDTQDIAATLDRIIKLNEERVLIDQNEQQKGNTESSVDPLEEIAKLKKLLDMDAITQDEFEAKKKQLLDL